MFPPNSFTLSQLFDVVINLNLNSQVWILAMVLDNAVLE